MDGVLPTVPVEAGREPANLSSIYTLVDLGRFLRTVGIRSEHKAEARDWLESVAKSSEDCRSRHTRTSPDRARKFHRLILRTLNNKHFDWNCGTGNLADATGAISLKSLGRCCARCTTQKLSSESTS